MPMLNGFDVFSAANKTIKSNRTRFIFATALEDIKVIKTAQDLGNEYFLFKPFSKESIENVILKYKTDIIN